MRLSTCSAALIVLTGTVGMRTQAQVVINEVSAANWSDVAVGGEYHDWIELYNAGAAAVDLLGYHLSDDLADPGKWAFPATLILAPGQHVVVYASKLDGMVAGEPHTNFKLTQTKQEHVVFSDPGLALLDDLWIEFPNQKNHSWGRTTDGAPNWGIFTSTTPGAANAGALSYYEARPVISPAAGGYAGSVSVTITAAPGATIRYTLDGSVPTAASPLYAGALTIASTTVVRSVAFNAGPGVPPSFVETNTYFINVTHTVPVWSLASDDVDDLLNGSLAIISEGNLEHFDAALQLQGETYGEFNEHGGTSNSNDQRAVDYVVQDEFGYADKIEEQLFRGKSRDKFQRVILKAAAGDNFPGYNGAHIRDAYIQSISQKIGLNLDERTYEPCVAYVNGQYWGVYETREKVDDNDYTEAYYDQPGERVDMIQQYGSAWADFGTVDGWVDLYNFIIGNNMADPANYAQVKDTLNTLSMIDHMIINEYMVNGSWLLFNTMWWRGKDAAGDHKKFGYTLWDADWILGTPYNEFGFPPSTATNDPCDHENVSLSVNPPNGLAGTHFEMFNALMNNPDFRQEYLDRYADLINTGLSCASTVGHLDSLIALIEPEMPAHCARWGGAFADWQANVQYMRDFLNQRCAFIVQGIEDCYDVHAHDIVVLVDPPGTGMVHLNTLDLTSFPWSGTYFDSLQLDFMAEAYTGWQFAYWSTDSNTVNPTTLDSAMWIQLLHGDTIIAHFVPDVTWPVVFSVEPPNSGTITFGPTTFTSFPHLENVPEGVPYEMVAVPKQYYEFIRWEIKNNAYVPNDPLIDSLSITFFAPDTIIAHFKPVDYGYYVPNAFTPNEDGINDLWLPLGDRIDLERYEVNVFDRWGEAVFHTTDLSEGWDGSVRGTAAPIGVYAFRIAVTDAVTDEHYTLKGHVSIVR